ncbi:MAG: helix-turn-helix transcriptional regulator [Candidatus Promineofilum sp.]|nr:helix-turn-helix transcriptional regulator [Promineifilum sp.]
MPDRKVVLPGADWNAGLQAYADLLRRRREDVLRLTQAEIASCLGLNQSTISRIESGARPRDKPTALAIAEAYRLSPAETRVWLELLFGAPTVPMTDSTPWEYSLGRVYEVLERARAKIPPPHIYITISSRSCQRR